MYMYISEWSAQWIPLTLFQVSDWFGSTLLLQNRIVRMCMFDAICKQIFDNFRGGATQNTSALTVKETRTARRSAARDWRQPSLVHCCLHHSSLLYKPSDTYPAKHGEIFLGNIFIILIIFIIAIIFCKAELGGNHCSYTNARVFQAQLGMSSFGKISYQHTTWLGQRLSQGRKTCSPHMVGQ